MSVKGVVSLKIMLKSSKDSKANYFLKLLWIQMYVKTALKEQWKKHKTVEDFISQTLKLPLNCFIRKGYFIDKCLMGMDYSKKTIKNSNERSIHKEKPDPMQKKW